MTLNQLEYAVALEQHRSFNKAAEKLGITQPALSLQIKKLEEELELQLFNRNTSPVEVTVDGEEFLARAKQVLADTRRLIHFSQELKSGYGGTLKVGVIPTLAPFLVPLFANELQRDFPDFCLDIEEAITDKVLNGVRNGTLDLGIISTPFHGQGFLVKPLFYEQFFFYSSNRGFLAQQEIRPESIPYNELWLLEEGNCFRDQINNFCDLDKMREHKHFIYRSHSIDALIRIVDTKGGMTILPELSTLSLNEDQEERIRIMSGRPKAREISLVTTRNYDKKRFISKVEEYIRRNIPHHMLHADKYEVVDPQIRV